MRHSLLLFDLSNECRDGVLGLESLYKTEFTLGITSRRADNRPKRKF